MERVGSVAQEAVPDERLFETIHNGTIPQLDRAATTLRAHGGVTYKAFTFTGTVPDWPLPDDILFVRRDAKAPWVMTYEKGAKFLREAEANMKAMYATPQTDSPSGVEKTLEERRAEALRDDDDI